MVEELTSGFLRCINPCNFAWQNFSLNQVKPAGFGLFDGTDLDDMGECEECKIRFSFLRRKKLCGDCGLSYCGSCIRRQATGRRQCRKCNILSHWPINRAEIASLRVRDLQHFLRACHVPTNTYKEKQDLIDLVIVQLKHRHLGRSRERRQSSTTPESTNTANAPNTTTRDDGIRVRPLHTASGNTNLTAESAFVPETTDEASGIRVFASAKVPESQVLPSAPEIIERCDSTSSSGWSIIDAELQPNRSSQESLSHSSNIEDPTNAFSHSSNIDNPTNDDGAHGAEIEYASPAFEQNDGESLPQVEGGVSGGDNRPSDQENTTLPSSHDSRVTIAADVVKLSALKTEESIKDLSIRQCKEILTLHRVDFSGVREKHELVNKIKMLWKDYQLRMKEEKNMPEEQLCKICMDAMMDCVLLECGHIVSCTECGKQMAECPVCRQNVIRVVKTFRA